MNEAMHERWTLQLSDYLDGDLDPEATRAMEAHLADCASCRGVLTDLRELVGQAGALGDVAPSRDLWPRIADAIRPAPPGGGQVLEFPIPAGRPRRLGLFLTGGQLAAASVALVVISAAATWVAGSRLAPVGAASVPQAPAAAVRAVDDAWAPPADLAGELSGLETVLAEARDRLDANTVRILEKNLGVIQRAIDESAQALAVDPSNAFLRDHLERAYREKAAFLREVTTFVDWEG